MATKILIKKSSTSGGAPLAADLEQGEFAVNLADRKIYTKDNSNAIVRLDGAYVGATAPSNASEGDLWYDTANDILKAYNGTAFNASGYSTLDSLENVTITSNSSGEILKWNGSAWVNNTLAEAGIQPAGSYAAATHTHAASDITSGTFNDARVAESNVTQHQAALSITESQISDFGAYIGDVTSEPLGDLSDVTITNIASGEILKWSGTSWINNTLSEAGIAAASHNHAASAITSGTFADARIAQSNVTQHEAALSITESQISDLGSYITDVSGDNLSALADVTITTIGSGELLKWNGTAWVNNTLAEAGVAAASHTHAASAITSGTFADGRIAQSNVTQHQAALSITESQISDLGSYLTGITGENIQDLSNVTVTSVASGEILKWNGTAWVNNTLAEAGIQPSGSYLTSESDTLASVTGRGATTSTAVSITNNTASSSTTTGALKVTGGVGVGGNLNVGGNTIITGNLTVNGTTTTVNSNEVAIGDSIIVLNSDETGAPSQDGGIEIERGTSANVSFLWDESAGQWSLGGETLGDVIIDGGSY